MPPSSTAAPERCSNVSSSTLTRLRGQILNGQIPPGEKLHLEQLKATYNVSLSPLREALSRLVSEGLVIQVDQRGFQVAPVSKENLDEVTVLRQTMEVMALREAISKGDDAWEAEVVSALHRLSNLSPRGEANEINEEWEHWHRQLHMALLRGCRAPVMLQFCDTLLDLSDRYRRIFFRPTPAPRDVHSEHRAIAEAALARDADKACDLMRKHIAVTCSLIESALPPDLQAA